MKYSGAPSEPLRRRYNTFLDACTGCGIEDNNKNTLLLLLQNIFLQVAALIYYRDQVKTKVSTIGEAIRKWEANFLVHRAKRVNDEV